MARHEIVIHENTSATSAAAPYLGNYIAKETLALAAFASAIGAKCGLPAIQVIAILDDAIQLDLSDVVPTIVTDENVTKLRVDNVMDLEEERPMNLIHGQHVFRVAGFNMVLSDEGAAAYLENALGTTFPLVIDEVVSKQLFKAHTAELLPAGDYKLVVKSRAGDADGPLQTSFRKVKYLRVVDPAPEPTFTGVYPAEYPGEAEFADVVYEDGDIVIQGTNLTADMQVALLKNGSEEATFTMGEATPTAITGHINGNVAVHDEFAFTLKTAGGTTVGTTTIYCNEHP